MTPDYNHITTFQIPINRYPRVMDGMPSP